MESGAASIEVWIRYHEDRRKYRSSQAAWVLLIDK